MAWLFISVWEMLISQQIIINQYDDEGRDREVGVSNPWEAGSPRQWGLKIREGI